MKKNLDQIVCLFVPSVLISAKIQQKAQNLYLLIKLHSVLKTVGPTLC